MDNNQTEQYKTAYQQYLAIFQNDAYCQAYVKGGILNNGKSISVPTDPQARKGAMDAAQAVMAQVSQTNKTAAGSWNGEGDVHYQAAAKFIRQCSSYNKSSTRAHNKDQKQFFKDNKGAGTGDTSVYVPASDSVQDILVAAEKAGTDAAANWWNDNQAGIDQIQQLTAKWMQNAKYQNTFWYAFYSKVKGRTAQEEAQFEAERRKYKVLYDSYKGTVKDNFNINAVDLITQH